MSVSRVAPPLLGPLSRRPLSRAPLFPRHARFLPLPLRPLHTLTPSCTAKKKLTPARSFSSSSFLSVPTSASPSSAGASASSTKKRRSVTVFNDDGHVPWTQLSRPEKVHRAAQQSANGALMAVAFVATVAIAYVLYDEVLAPDSKVANFARSFDLIRRDPTCLSLLVGDEHGMSPSAAARQLTAHGDETFNKWRRARPIASSVARDRHGREHLRIQFYVEGPKNRATVHVHMTRRTADDDFAYRMLAVDVPGHERVILRQAEDEAPKSSRLFGIRWS